jgi:CheY-like chemotaxis protein
MTDGGTLRIETAKVEVSDSSTIQAPESKDGPWVVLRVKDTGGGIDPSVQGQIFEPFVTTKEASQGTGLGLSTVYGVVNQCKGHIRVDSKQGRGTIFEIFLPAIDQPVAETVQRAAASELPGGNETILLVEDEAAVRSLLRRFLDSQGYRVIEASAGEAAIDKAEGYNGGFDLLLTDLVMPGMGGFELARRLEAQRPDLKVIFMSGYSEEAVRGSDTEPVMDSTNFLQKPFSTDLLARRLRAVLDSD